jgi:hypothetical protein
MDGGEATGDREGHGSGAGFELPVPVGATAAEGLQGIGRAGAQLDCTLLATPGG